MEGFEGADGIEGNPNPFDSKDFGDGASGLFRSPCFHIYLFFYLWFWVGFVLMSYLLQLFWGKGFSRSLYIEHENLVSGFGWNFTVRLS